MIILNRYGWRKESGKIKFEAVERIKIVLLFFDEKEMEGEFNWSIVSNKIVVKAICNELFEEEEWIKRFSILSNTIISISLFEFEEEWEVKFEEERILLNKASGWPLEINRKRESERKKDRSQEIERERNRKKLKEKERKNERKKEKMRERSQERKKERERSKSRNRKK